MKLHVWKNQDGYHLSRPTDAGQLTEVDFDPDQLCRQCGERVLSISSDRSNICPWCESSVNRPKILRYQELDMVRLLRDQSDKNKLHKTKPRRMIGNRSTEKDLRDFLTENGYYGNSANFHKLELAAIERPGWVQVFEFHVLAKSVDGDWVELFGNCRSDERNKSLEVNLFDSNVDQSQAFRDETAEMITLDRGPRHWTYWPLMTFFVALLAVAAYGAWLANKPEIAENAPGQSTSQPVAQPELPAEPNTDAETAPIR